TVCANRSTAARPSTSTSKALRELVGITQPATCEAWKSSFQRHRAVVAFPATAALMLKNNAQKATF
ncbi:hypothetical protein, partial [Brevundimonas sp. MEB006b]|uniref:hypothetical protein n=1 Tax=Brevundimonas sp. MEB006b TaxID=3040283 RepID=UPI00254DEADF